MRLLLPFFLALAVSSPALGGELGPTSRETVTIRVTVPQRIDVAGIPAVTSGGPGGLCLVSNAPTGPYRVSVLAADDSAGMSAGAESRAAELPPTPIGPLCAHPNSKSPAFTPDMAALRNEAKSGQPITILVAPE